jgi:hypothetical protein
MMILGQHPVDPVLLGMEVVKTGLETDDHKDQQKYGNPGRKPRYVDNGIGPVTRKAPDGSFDIISEHGMLVMLKSRQKYASLPNP